MAYWPVGYWPVAYWPVAYWPVARGPRRTGPWRTGPLAYWLLGVLAQRNGPWPINRRNDPHHTSPNYVIEACCKAIRIDASLGCGPVREDVEREMRPPLTCRRMVVTGAPEDWL